MDALLLKVPEAAAQLGISRDLAIVRHYLTARSGR